VRHIDRGDTGPLVTAILIGWRKFLSELKLMRDFLLFHIRWTSQYLGKVSDYYDNALPQGMPRINRCNDI